ncbi:hypothetical protein GW17_00052780 [Ensete ventricosum]|nr:hypothetical protein GW17_00052780 [Ensete ventricosum]
MASRAFEAFTSIDDEDQEGEQAPKFLSLCVDEGDMTTEIRKGKEQQEISTASPMPAKSQLSLLTLTPPPPPSPALGHRPVATANRCPTVSTMPPIARLPYDSPHRTPLPPSSSPPCVRRLQPAAAPAAITLCSSSTQPHKSPPSPLLPLLPTACRAQQYYCCCLPLPATTAAVISPFSSTAATSAATSSQLPKTLAATLPLTAAPLFLCSYSRDASLAALLLPFVAAMLLPQPSLPIIPTLLPFFPRPTPPS